MDTDISNIISELQHDGSLGKSPYAIVGYLLEVYWYLQDRDGVDNPNGHQASYIKAAIETANGDIALLQQIEDAQKV